jgi:hypothetical protein
LNNVGGVYSNSYLAGLSGSGGTNIKILASSLTLNGVDGSARWNIRTTNTEAASNVGTDFQIQRFSNTGVPIATALLITRSTGFVGVGVAAPAYALDIMGDCNLSAGSVYRINGVPISTGGTGSQTPWLSDIDGASFNLNSCGSIGLGGLSSPSLARIIVRTSGGGVDALRSLDSSAAGYAGVAFYNDQNHGLRLLMTGSTAAAIAPNAAVIDFSGGSSPLVFSVSNLEKMRLTSAGQLGIGKTPAFPLDAAGDINTTGVYRINGVPLVAYPGITVQNFYPGTRLLGTTYQNTTGKPMFVNIMAFVPGGATLSCYSDANPAPAMLVCNTTNTGTASAILMISFWVLAGNYYKILGGTSVNQWIEWN